MFKIYYEFYMRSGEIRGLTFRTKHKKIYFNRFSKSIYSTYGHFAKEMFI